MSIWQQLRSAFGISARTHLDKNLVRSVRDLARREQRAPDEVIVSLLNQAILGRQAAEHNWRRWQALTPRERQITALVCLNLTSRQVAARLVISPETVKTHVRNILRKFGLRSRAQLRRALAGWDFKTWLA